MGSPPRVREKPYHSRNANRYSGITPACAGKTAQQTAFHTVRWDHPRVCGKNTQMMDAAQNVKGSPPRVREKHDADMVKAAVVGITPACAGKTAASHYGWCRAWDHPRVCGKNVSAILLHLYYQGSPPRVREKLCNTVKFFHILGITPACAGKTHKIPCSKLR